MNEERAIRWMKTIGRDVITLEEPQRSEAIEAIAIAILAIRQKMEVDERGKDGKES